MEVIRNFLQLASQAEKMRSGLQQDWSSIAPTPCIDDYESEMRIEIFKKKKRRVPVPKRRLYSLL